jgi:hypothetical protein
VPESYYLSDASYEWMKRSAGRERIPVSFFIEAHYPEWVEQRFCIKDSGMIELIEARRERVRRELSPSAVERNDGARRRYAAPDLYDGVVWHAMFGSWKRRARELRISRDCIEALAAWVQRENVVQRRAASASSLAGQSLELIGRGWIGER